MNSLATKLCLLLVLSGSSGLSTHRRHSSFDHVLKVPLVNVVGRRGLSEVAETSEVEIQALVDLYYSKNGDEWTDSTGWLLGDPCVNEWHGVFCDEDRGLWALSLRNNNMTGILNESIGA